MIGEFVFHDQWIALRSSTVSPPLRIDNPRPMLYYISTVGGRWNAVLRDHLERGTRLKCRAHCGTQFDAGGRGRSVVQPRGP